eukprot:354069-Chlamydomonas_euryale.AAC.15
MLSSRAAACPHAHAGVDTSCTDVRRRAWQACNLPARLPACNTEARVNFLPHLIAVTTFIVRQKMRKQSACGCCGRRAPGSRAASLLAAAALLQPGSMAASDVEAAAASSASAAAPLKLSMAVYGGRFSRRRGIRIVLRRPPAAAVLRSKAAKA